MKLFDIVNGKVVPDANILAMPEFKVLWSRDKNKDKNSAIKEISYVTFLCDETINNPYRAYRYDERERVLRRDYIKDEKWEPDEKVKNAIKKFKEATETTNSRLLRSAKSATEKLSEYFDKVDFNEVDKDGKSKYSSKELASNLKDVGGIVRSLNQLEELVRKEQSESVVRGGGEIGFYEIPRDDINYGV